MTVLGSAQEAVCEGRCGGQCNEGGSATHHPVAVDNSNHGTVSCGGFTLNKQLCNHLSYAECSIPDRGDNSIECVDHVHFPQNINRMILMVELHE